MKFAFHALSLALATAGVAGSSFRRDVVGHVNKKTNLNKARHKLQQRILAKARPYSRDLYYNDANNADADVNEAEYYNKYEGDLDYDNFQFDVSSYSFKYVKCQTIRTFSNNIAEYQGDGYMPKTVLEREQFVVFRFCPTAYCSTESNYGCESDYGEYILLLSDYLSAMKDYNDDRLQAYCDYCEQCMGQGNRGLANNNNNYAAAGDDAAAAGDDAAAAAAGDDAAAAAAGDDGAAAGDDAAAAAAGDDAAAAGDDVANADADGAAYYSASSNSNCASYDQCYNYQSKCNNEDESAVAYSTYFACTEVADSYGGSHFVGPKCASNGKSISFSVFKDQYCTEVNENMSATDLLGITISDDEMAVYYQETCISCKESDLPWEVTDGDEQDDDTVSEICETLYYDAAKCNANYKNFYFSANYGGYNRSDLQLAEDNKVCYYIQNVLQGYDEYGEIYLDSSFHMGGETSSAQNLSQFSSVEVTPLQIVGILFSVLFCVALAGYSCYLHRAIMKKAPWRPNRGGAAAVAGQISRQNSGIVIGRSRSSGSTHYSPGGQLA